MQDFSDKNLFLTLLALLLSIGYLYMTIGNHKRLKSRDEDDFMFYKGNVIKGYVLSIPGVILTVFQLFKWLIEYFNSL